MYEPLPPSPKVTGAVCYRKGALDELLPQHFDLGLNLARVDALGPEEAYGYILRIEEEIIPKLPPIKTRTKRVEDIRGTFEDKHVFLRVYLQMCLSDLYNRVSEEVEVVSPSSSLP